jgi:hypothetical protein
MNSPLFFFILQYKGRRNMTRTTERYYCDICGKESLHKLKGKSYINNEDDRPGYMYIHYTEVYEGRK